MRSNSTTRFLFICFVICSLNETSSGVFAGDLPPKAVQEKNRHAGDKNDSAPMAFIMVTPEYQNKDQMLPLKYILDSAVKMATEFNKIGYQVTFVTEEVSFGSAEKKLKSCTGMSLEKVQNSIELNSRIKNWFALVAQRKPPIAILVLVGHGEERVVVDKDGSRQKVPFYLTRPDVSGRGGLSLEDLKDVAARPDAVPTVVVVDMCRLPASLQITSSDSVMFQENTLNSFMVTTEFKTANAPKISLGKDDKLPLGLSFADTGNGTATISGTPVLKSAGNYLLTITATSDKQSVSQVLEVKVLDTTTSPGAYAVTGVRIAKSTRKANGDYYPTMMYSTISGEVAKAMDSLTENLAVGLGCGATVQEWLRWRTNTPKQGSFDVSLGDWLNYGKAGLDKSHKGLQSAQIQESAIAPLESTSVFRVKGDKSIPPIRFSGVVDLLDGYKSQAGNIVSNIDSRLGLTLSRKMGANDTWYCVGTWPHENGKSRFFDVKDKLFQMDVYASKANTGVIANQMEFEVRFARSTKPKWSPFEGSPTSIKLAIGALTRIDIPFNPSNDKDTNKPFQLCGLDILGEKNFKFPNGKSMYAWPDEVALHVVEMKITNPTLSGKGPINQLEQSLIRRWSFLSSSADNSYEFGIPKGQENKVYRLSSPKDQNVQISGTLMPRVYATPNSVISIEAYAKKTSELSIDLVYEDPQTLKRQFLGNQAKLKFAEGQSITRNIKLSENQNGYVTHLVLNFSGDIDIKQLSLKPAPLPPVKAKK
ncbi:MAG: Ig domain-containing protein [Fimbriiglobus sp.]